MAVAPLPTLFEVINERAKPLNSEADHAHTFNPDIPLDFSTSPPEAGFLKPTASTMDHPSGASLEDRVASLAMLQFGTSLDQWGEIPRPSREETEGRFLVEPLEDPLDSPEPDSRAASSAPSEGLPQKKRHATYVRIYKKGPCTICRAVKTLPYAPFAERETIPQQRKRTASMCRTCYDEYRPRRNRSKSAVNT